jgi:enoyl-CoA hydratase/carnithine racemase
MIDVIEHGSIREIRLARPPVNALSPEFLVAIREAVTRAPEEGAEAIVLSGQPGMFSSGLDVPVLIQLDRDGLAGAVRELFAAMHALAACPVPVAAAITGHSPAGGAVLAMHCDWRVMADGDFGIGLTEVQVGIPLPRSIAEVAALVVGRRRAEEICTAGLLMTPVRALEVGFVDRLAPIDEVVPVALEWCRGLLTLPRSAMSRTRSLFRAEVAETIRSFGEDSVADFGEQWFRPEVYDELRRLVERLKKK